MLCLQVLLSATVFRNHILFTVMAIAMVSAADPVELMEDVHRYLFPTLLQETMPSASAKQAHTTLVALEAAMAAASQGCNATVIQKRVTALLVSMLALDDAGIAAVDKANARTVSDVTYRVADADVKHSLTLLDTIFHQVASETQASLNPMRKEVQQVTAAMAAAMNIDAESMGTSFETVLEVCPPPCLPLH